MYMYMHVHVPRLCTQCSIDIHSPHIVLVCTHKHYEYHYNNDQLLKRVQCGLKPLQRSLWSCNNITIIGSNLGQLIVSLLHACTCRSPACAYNNISILFRPIYIPIGQAYTSNQ